MTDEQFERLMDFVRPLALPPSRWLPDGIGVPVVVVPNKPEPETIEDRGRYRIEMSMADYVDLHRRAERATPEDDG